MEGTGYVVVIVLGVARHGKTYWSFGEVRGASAPLLCPRCGKCSELCVGHSLLVTSSA